MASLAVIQGSSKGIGLAFSRYLLQNTKLNVYATSQRPDDAKKAILEGLDKDAAGRLTTAELDVTREDSIATAAKQAEEKFSKSSLRLLINVSGMLRAEKSISAVDADSLMRTFQINTFGHLLVFKHFLPLLPKKKESGSGSSDDPAQGLIKSDLSVLASMSAKVGSIGDNERGGWYSYRASKASVNQIIKGLNIELGLRSSAPAIALALHPGSVAGTELSKDFVPQDQAGSKKGVHSADEAAELLLKVISKQGPKDGGSFLSWDGSKIPW